ncbi:hypothetical protein COW36_09125 [bacterium (Candidatus Blackallbacteria) CG17_big_fil_post_rev_8_21_14_2_50_48_46]|uniref:Uncharacterized protein n=1 Tax=bacterium (Candidatus Blackallbacteria) CG17_big_fil_post_rev_8_21_14_2_50_48_46 TaxID=2014261 RepID=A0A2M7G5R5_9BACT|nr:MAG: hypothetical protein COW64_23925 [bacterium (Candidatus Blackallbacteria) CG18_big_fil_WC_8_21_14_2_50_49_26]PIW17327.1 MAG: hypothetical protein COW36_09125 [bacterium (Candidatus Blackallbacteria) CG17_big_fil_post_rev_8_21_14_2_50_48_46]PIW47441.1 MAG: hypothetical protein COW20_12705 [bacterium (Candidatus Blackallbacteria) CG13_big_fil_rev_8_21_14_2_50_49_14]
MAIYQRRGVKITVENQQYNADLSLHLVSGTITLRCPFFGSKPYIFNSNSEDARQLEAKMRTMFLNADKGVPYENR